MASPPSYARVQVDRLGSPERRRGGGLGGVRGCIGPTEYYLFSMKAVDDPHARFGFGRRNRPGPASSAAVSDSEKLPRSNRSGFPPIPK